MCVCVNAIQISSSLEQSLKVCRYSVVLDKLLFFPFFPSICVCIHPLSFNIGGHWLYCLFLIAQSPLNDTVFSLPLSYLRMEKACVCLSLICCCVSWKLISSKFHGWIFGAWVGQEACRKFSTGFQRWCGNHKSSYCRRCMRWMMSRQSLNTRRMFSVSTAQVKCG